MQERRAGLPALRPRIRSSPPVMRRSRAWRHELSRSAGRNSGGTGHARSCSSQPRDPGGVQPERSNHESRSLECERGRACRDDPLTRGVVHRSSRVGARSDRRAQRAPQRDRHRLLRGGVARRRAPGSGGRQGGCARAVARRPGHHQGERGRRRAAHHQRLARVRGPHRPGPLSGGAQPPRRRRGHRGAHQYPGALDAGDDGQPAAWQDSQSVGRRGVAGRVLGRGVGRGGDGVRTHPPRQRHRRVAALSRLRVRGGDGEADLRAGARVQPERVRRARPARAAHLRTGRGLPRGAGRAARNPGAVGRRPAQIRGGCRRRSTGHGSILPSRSRSPARRTAIRPARRSSKESTARRTC